MCALAYMCGMRICLCVFTCRYVYVVYMGLSVLVHVCLYVCVFICICAYMCGVFVYVHLCA